MKKIILLLFVISIVLSFFFVNKYYDEKCNSYDWDKGALFTTQGVFCERTVRSSWDVPFLPMEGARRQHEYRNKPDPRFIPGSKSNNL